MPLNLIKNYNELLEIGPLTRAQRHISLYGVFTRDFIQNTPLTFLNKVITPTPQDGVATMDTLYHHLTTQKEVSDKPARIFDFKRSERLHWVRFHLNFQKREGILHFSVKEKEGLRTYIYDVDEQYVVVLEPLRDYNEYYLLSAYKLEGKDRKRDKILRKYRRRLDQLL